MIIANISDAYISYLRGFDALKNVYDSKELERIHTRKYLGAVIEKNGLKYFIPFSSPKPNDWVFDIDGNKSIRKSMPAIVRMTHQEANKKIELLGTLRISHMIPVPESELVHYRINDETDLKYKILVSKQLQFINSHANEITKNATLLYNQKTNITKTGQGANLPQYINAAIDYLYAEQKCEEYIRSTISKVDVLNKQTMLDACSEYHELEL